MLGTGAEIEAAKAVVGLVELAAERVVHLGTLAAAVIKIPHCGSSLSGCPRAGF